MIFEKLELINFKSHEKSTIDFDNGITLIIGENGAGKSSIFEAITFALFSESLVNNIDLVRTNRGISDKMVMEVKLTFQANSNRYRVEKSITKKNDKQTAGARLFKVVDGFDHLITEGATRVNNEIQMILNMNAKTFLNAIHIRQGQISSLIDDKPAERKKLIGQLLRLDDLEKAHKEMPNVMNDFVMEAGKIQAQIQDEDALAEELESNTQLKEQVSAENAVFATDLENLKNVFDAISLEKTALDEQEKKLETLKLKNENDLKLLENLTQSKTDLEGRLEEIARNEKQMEELKPFCERLPVLRQFKDTILKRTSLKKDESLKAEVLDKINQYKAVIENERESHEKYLELESELEELNRTKTQIESEIKVADSLEASRKKSQSEVERYDEILTAFYSDCENILSEYDVETKDVSLDEISTKVAELADGIKNTNTEIDDKINRCNAEIGSLKQEIKSSTKPLNEVKEVENKCPTCQSEITAEKKNQLIDTYETVISECTGKIDEAKNLIETLNAEKASNNDKIKSLEGLNTQINRNMRIPEHLEKLAGEIEELTQKIEELSQKQVKLSEITEAITLKADELKSLEENHKRFIEAETLLLNLDGEDEIKSQIDKISSEISILENSLEELISKDSTLSLDTETEKLDSEIADLTQKDQIYHTLEGSLKHKGDYESKLAETLEQIKAKQAEIESSTKTIEECKYDSENHKKLTEQVSESTLKINDLEKNIAVNETRIQAFADKITEISEKIRENRILVRQFKAISQYIDILDDFKFHYGKNGIQKDLRAQSKPLIQKYTRDFFEKFNFNYSDLKLSDEYDISIYGPEGEVKLGMVSGGEKIAIALSLRLGITQVMSQGNIETILLDEPTIHLDSFRRQELINVLRSMSVIPQMIIVTHDEELETAADSLIKIVKDDGISKVMDD